MQPFPLHRAVAQDVVFRTSRAMFACPEIHHAVGHAQQPGVRISDIWLGYQRVAVGQGKLHAGIDPPGAVQPGGPFLQGLCFRSQMVGPFVVTTLTGILGQFS